ncbi:UpxY family transcription antiterminator [candidate division KSB1 bacterium]|nr:UpxY family transcription antiterminator [candidate division KSB1 bacterium]
MSDLQRDERWYAFVVRPRHEKKVKTYLDKKGIVNFLPVRKTLNQWKDRRRWVESPMFSCYIFARIAFVHRFEVLTVPSVVRQVMFNNEPTPIEDREIEAIEMILASGQTFEVEDGLVPGDRVCIRSGPLAGMEGALVERRNSRWLVISIQAINKSVLVDAGENRIEII